MNQFIALFESSAIYTLGALFFLVMVATFVLNQILTKLYQKSQKTKNYWDDVIITSIKSPAQILLWYLWLYYTVNTLIQHYPSIGIISPVLNIVPLLLITWLIFRLISRLAKAMSDSKDRSIDLDSINLIARLLKIFLIIISALMVAQYFGLSVAGILTFGGMGGIIMGFAAKDMLANIFGGLMLQIDKPFSTGDWIRAKDHNIEGTVEKIGWRMTKVITFSKNPIYIPNSIFATIPIETPSRMSNRRIKATIGVRYDDVNNILNIISEIRDYLQNHDDIDHNKTLMVNLNEFNAYSVDFFIYTFTKTTNWQQYHNTKQEVLLFINDIISRNGAQIAFPTQVNYLIKDTV